MALTAAELVAYLRIDKSDFDRGLSGAEGQMRKTSGRFRDWSKGMGQALVDVTAGAAAATAGLASAAFFTGVNYNTLQQSSRAALTTIMDGGEAANAQMDRLDDFASNSPFAKDVFIQAQQQLLGFGQEAEDVIPTLSAIEDSVAAVGGSNRDIAEVANVMANIIGTGKITGETLQQLGTRGIDAATIIGEEMGKSGATIREEITSGSLDAGVALKALTDGMTERFGGAAANVKETAVGASDRIRAAFRDIGSHLATPFVDPRGGGLAIEWSNQFADVMRSLQQHVPAFTDMMVDRFGGAFDSISLNLLDAKDAIDRFDVQDLSDGLDKLGSYAPAVAGLSGALLTMATKNIPYLGGLSQALGPIPAALGAAALASPEMRDALGEIGSALQPLLPVLGDLAGLVAGAFTEAVGIAADVLGVVAGIVRPLAEGFAELPEPIKLTVGALGTLMAVRSLAPNFGTAFTKAFSNISGGIKGTINQFRGWDTQFQGAAGEALTFGTKLDIVRSQLGRTSIGGLRGAVNSFLGLFGGPWGLALTGATVALGFWAQKQQEAKARTDELKDSLDEQTGAFTEASEAIILKQLQEELTSEKLDQLSNSMETFGVTSADMVTAITDQGEAYDVLRQKIVDKHIELEHSEEDAVKMAENSPVLKYVNDQIEAYEVEQEAVRAVAEAQKELDAQLDEGERSHKRYQEALAIMSDETKTAEERTRGLENALDELNGGAKTSEERARDLAAQTRNLSEYLADATDAEDGFRGSLFNTELGMISHTDEGDRLAEMLDRMARDAKTAALEAAELAEKQGRSGEAAAEAAEAIQPYIDEVREAGEAAELTDEEIDLMIQQMKLVPEEIAFVITDGDSIEATDIELYALMARIRELPDGETTITDNDTSQDVIDELIDLGAVVTELPEGEVEIDVTGIPEAELEMDAFVNKKRTAKVDFIIGSTPSPAGNYGVPYAPGKAPTTYGGGMGREYSIGPRFHGGIDTFRGTGMAAGGLTGPSVMDVAQFVKPGDIRYAGDRTDVDEAWVPLDGSSRSRKILDEAIARMPNYEPPGEGMAAGGITGDITPPQVDGVDAPDTSDLTGVWQDAMTFLAESTQSTFDGMETETAAAQAAMQDDVSTAGSTMSADLLAAGSTMSDAVSTAGASMSSDVAAAGSAMTSTTQSTQQNMTTDTATQLANRLRDTQNQNQAMSTDTARNLADMADDTRSETSTMRDVTQTNISAMRTGAHREITGLRSESGTEFREMRTQGIDAATDLRDGLVDRMGSARTPFTGRVNDLVTVMRDFSSALNDAYGDMGVKVGSPSSISAWTGAILPGYTPGRDVHTFQSSTAGRLNLSGGEGIARPEVVRAMGPSEFMRLNAAARRGGVSAVRSALGANQREQSFADGGIFDVFGQDARDIRDEYKPKLPDNWVRPVGSQVMDDVVDGVIDSLSSMMDATGWVRPTTGRVTSRYGAGRGAWPHAGMDIAKSEGTPTVSPTFGVVKETGWNLGPGRSGIGALVDHPGDLLTYYGHNPVGGLRVKPGDTLGPGDRIGAQGNTGNSTGAHLHWEVHQGGPWRDINPHPFWDAAGGGSGVAIGGGGSDRWAGAVQTALRLVGLPTNARYTSAWLRQIQTESGGNPNAVQGIVDINSRMGNLARGLVQVIPPTFAAYSLPGMKNIMHPLHNLAAGMNYAKNRYGVGGMLSAIGRGRGYKNGTNSALPGWHAVGEEGMELIKFRGGETVKNNRQTQSMLGAGTLTEQEADMLGRAFARHAPAGGDLVLNGPVTRDTDELVRKGTTAFRRTYKHLSRTR